MLDLTKASEKYETLGSPSSYHSKAGYGTQGVGPLSRYSLAWNEERLFCSWWHTRITTCEYACLCVCFFHMLHVCLYTCVSMCVQVRTLRMGGQDPLNGHNCLLQLENVAILEKCINAHSSKAGISNSMPSPILPLFSQLRKSPQ